MLAGSDCVDGISPKFSPSCTYSRRFADGLASIFGSEGPSDAHGSLDWVSLASGGTTTAGVLPSLSALLQPYAGDAAAGLPTLLLVDYSANDAEDSEAQK